MVTMFEVEMQFLFSDMMTEKEVRAYIKDFLDAEPDIDLTHIIVRKSEDKCKDWIIDRDRRFQLKNIIDRTKNTQPENYDIDGDDKDAYFSRE